MGLFGKSDQNRPKQMVREYTRPGQFKRDAAKLAKQGWRVVAQTEMRQFLMPTKLVVTYARD